MAQHPHNEPTDQGPEQDDILKELDDIEKRLLHDIQDPRVSHGVPKEQRGSDLEFIQMSGITSPRQKEEPAVETPRPAAPLDVDSTQPLSFYEKGVKDVDSELAPGGALERESSEPPVAPRMDSRLAMAHLRDIIADLTRDADGNEVEADATESAGQDAVLGKIEGGEAPESAAAAHDEPSVPLIIEPVAEAEPTLATPEQSAALIQAETSGTQPEVIELPGPAKMSLQSLTRDMTPPDLATEPSVIPESEASGKMAPSRVEETVTPIAEDVVVEASHEESAASSDAVVDGTIESAADKTYSLHEEPASRDAADSEPIELPPSPDLLQAEQLLQEIEKASARDKGPIKPERPAPAIPEKEQRSISDTEAARQSVYSRVGPRHARRGTHSRKLKVQLLRGTAAAAALLLSAFVVVEAYAWFSKEVAGPSSLYDTATSYAKDGEYLRASDAYVSFASRHPDSPMRPDAQFAAAFTLQQDRPKSKDEVKAVYGKALELFDQFLKDNPTHPKAARAQVLMGSLYFELGEYRESIERLQDPELRLKDPASAVPALRTLARSCAKLGDDDDARSYYLQSAGISENHSPDVDFDELGSLYRSLAERATKAESRTKYEQQAIDQWTKATQVPGIDAASKKDIRTKIEVLKEQIARQSNEPGAAAASPDAGNVSAAATTTATESAAQVETTQPPDGTEPATNSQAAASDAQVPQATTPEDSAPAIEPPAPAAGPEKDSAPAGAVGAKKPATAAPPAEPAAVNITPQTPAPVSEPVAAAPPKTEYIVKAGDTLTAISLSHRITLQQLMAWNGLKSHVIYPGDKLRVTKPEETGSTSSSAPAANSPMVVDAPVIESPASPGEPK